MRIQRALYGLSQTARTAWYGGQYVLANRLAPPVAPPPVPGTMPDWRAIRGDLAALFKRDWANVEAGYYPPPADMLPPPGRALGKAVRFFRDLPAVNLRRRLGAADDVPRPEPACADGDGGTESGSGGRAYPAYFMQNFHFQTDGWLSEESAALYDHQVEVLFTGGADAMRRQALVPLGDWLAAHGTAGRQLVDIGCGTARFLYDVKRARPGLRVQGIDLSAAYLRRARRVLRRWGGVALTQAAAERLPLADGSADLVTSVYLFHELPKPVRRAVAAEMARVLRPGGRIVLVDSLQYGDHAPYDRLLARFPLVFHEPYYESYLGDDLAAVFAAEGLTPAGVARAFLSRVMVFDKPRS